MSIAMKSRSSCSWLLALLAFAAFATTSFAQIGLPETPDDGTCTVATAAANDGINWEKDLQAAQAKAKKLDRPVFIVFLCRFMGDCASPHA